MIYENPVNKLILSVFTMDKTKLGDHTVTLVNTIAYGGVEWTPTYTFNIKVVDPCDATVLTTQAIATLTTDNGVKGIREFTDIKDTVEVAKGQDTLCGPRDYSITYQNGNAITWVVVAQKAGSDTLWEITADPTLDAHATTHTLKLIVALNKYPAHPGLEINFNVVVVTPACQCALVGWTAPAVQTLTTTVKKIPADTLTISHGTVDAASLLLTPQIRACQGTCSTTTTISAIVDKSTGTLPSFMTLTDGVITVDAQSNSLIRTYEMKVTMTTPDSGDQLFETVIIKLDYCVITGLAKPTDPTDLAYSIFAAAALVNDLGTPGFQQVPACGYFLVNTFTWTIPSGAPIAQDTSTGSQYIIKT